VKLGSENNVRNKVVAAAYDRRFERMSALAERRYSFPLAKTEILPAGFMA